MDKIMAMREKRAEMWEQAKQFLDSHEKDGHLTAEDAKAYEQMENEVLALGKDIERIERQAILDRSLQSRPQQQSPIFRAHLSMQKRQGVQARHIAPQC